MTPWIFSLIAFALVACSSEPPPETKAAVLALKGLNSKLDVGLNLSGYAEALQETKVTVDQSIEAEPLSKNTQVIEKVMDEHLAAFKLWHCQIEDDQYAKDKCRKQVYEILIFPLDPELQQKIEQEKVTNSYGYTYEVDPDEVIQFLWRKAELDLNSLESK